MIARIAVAAANFAIDKPYSYRVPLGMEPVAGMRVQLGFGRGNRPTEGIVLSVEEGAEALRGVSVEEFSRRQGEIKVITPSRKELKYCMVTSQKRA